MRKSYYTSVPQRSQIYQSCLVILLNKLDMMYSLIFLVSITCHYVPLEYCFYISVILTSHMSLYVVIFVSVSQVLCIQIRVRCSVTRDVTSPDYNKTYSVKSIYASSL